MSISWGWTDSSKAGIHSNKKGPTHGGGGVSRTFRVGFSAPSENIEHYVAGSVNLKYRERSRS